MMIHEDLAPKPRAWFGRESLPAAGVSFAVSASIFVTFWGVVSAVLAVFLFLTALTLLSSRPSYRHIGVGILVGLSAIPIGAGITGAAYAIIG